MKNDQDFGLDLLISGICFNLRSSVFYWNKHLLIPGNPKIHEIPFPFASSKIPKTIYLGQNMVKQKGESNQSLTPLFQKCLKIYFTIILVVLESTSSALKVTI